MRVESGFHKFDAPDEATHEEIGRELAKRDNKLLECGLSGFTRMKRIREVWKYIDTRVLLDAAGVQTDLRSTEKTKRGEMIGTGDRPQAGHKD